MAAMKCIKACRCGQEIQLLFRLNVRMEKTYDKSDFDRGMIIGDRQMVLSPVIFTDHSLQITTHYNSGMQKSISEHTTCQTSKWIGYSSRSKKKKKKKV